MSEFGNNGNKSTDLNEKLKTDAINCKFYTTLGKFYQSNKHRFPQSQSDIAAKKNGSPILIKTKKSLDILNQLYFVLNTTRKIIGFVPLEVFCRIDPFKVVNKKSNYTHYYNYTLYTNNNSLLDFLHEVDVKNMRFKPNSPYGNSKSNLTKLKLIIKELNRQLVFHIDYIEGNRNVDIYFNFTQEVSPITTNWLMLDWKGVLKLLESSPENEKKALVLFTMGYFKKAFKIMYGIYSNAVREKKALRAFKALVELKNIQQFISIVPSSSIYSEFQEIKNLDVEWEYYKFRNSDRLEHELAKFIRDGSMISYAQILIIDLRDKVKESLDIHLRGGFSYNDHIGELQRAFQIFEHYIIWNSSMSIKFSEFHKIVENYSLGIILGVALNEFDTSHIECLDDKTLHRLILWGDVKFLEKHYRNFIKRQIPPCAHIKSIEKLIKNHFSTKRETLEALEPKEGGYVQSEYYRISWNIIFIVSITDFDAEFIRNFFKLIEPFINHIPDRESDRIKYFGSLLFRKGKYLSASTLRRWFVLFIERRSIHDIQLIAGIGSAAKEQKVLLVSTNECYFRVEEFLFAQCRCGNRHIEYLDFIFNSMSPKYKRRFKELIEKKLAERFDPELFYICSMIEIIRPELFIENYISSIKLSPKRSMPHQPLNNPVESEINKYLNLVFKYNLKIDSNISSILGGRSEYYKWLSDMENYDYSKFDPKWINYYQTASFLRKIFSIAPLRQIVKQYLKSHYHPVLSYHYSQMV